MTNMPAPRAPAGHRIDPSHRGKVSGKLKRVLDRVVQEGLDAYEAGRIEGLHARSIRLAFTKPYVLAYLRRVRQVLREEARAQNIHHMVKMRNEGTNEMAKLGAMRLIEQDDEFAHRSRDITMSPGLVIQVIGGHVQRQPTPPTIDVTPGKREPDRDPAD